MRSAITSNATAAAGIARRACCVRAAGRRSCLGARLAVVALTGVAGVGVVAGVLERVTPAQAATCEELYPSQPPRSGPSASLPDCRAYELVTPAHKSSAVQDLDSRGMQGIPAVNGERYALETVVAFGATPVTSGSLSVFARTPSGWQITSVPPSDAGSTYDQTPIFSSDLTQVGFTIETEEPPLGQTLEIGTPGGSYTTLAVASSTNSGETYVAAAAPDFSRVFLASTDHTLISGAPAGTVAGAHDVYEWAGGGACSSVTSNCKLVNVTSGGSLVGECGARLQSVSEDGSRAIFQSPDPSVKESSEPSCNEPSHLYMRVIETVAGREERRTVEVSEPNEDVVEHTGPQPVFFAAASADGSKVFFATATELTQDDEGVNEHEPGAKQLYEYDANAKAGDRLTRITNSETGEVGESESIVGGGDGGNGNTFISTDGSKVYFVTKSGGIYRYDTLSKEHRLVAATNGNSAGGSGEHRYNEVTPNGNFFVFVTPKDYGFPVANPEEYGEVYRYDDEHDSVTCVSCMPGGVQQTGSSALQTLPAGGGILERPGPPFTAISEDGSYVFFESTQSLVPQAMNVSGETRGEHANNADVYEWHDGVVSLISSPTDQRAQALLGASEDGSNVFFLTHASLVPQDIDTSADIYDARIGGGFPAQAESAACLGDTCLNVPIAPVDPTPAWSSFSGPGNLVVPVAAVMPKMVVKSKAKGCSRGRVRKKGRCVKRRKAKKAGRLAGGSVKHDRGGVE
jgi:hypothetical protein